MSFSSPGLLATIPGSSAPQCILIFVHQTRFVNNLSRPNDDASRVVSRHTVPTWPPAKVEVSRVSFSRRCSHKVGLVRSLGSDKRTNTSSTQNSQGQLDTQRSRGEGPLTATDSNVIFKRTEWANSCCQGTCCSSLSGPASAILRHKKGGAKKIYSHIVVFPPLPNAGFLGVWRPQTVEKTKGNSPLLSGLSPVNIVGRLPTVTRPDRA